jgi:hypothetical protein
MQFKMHFNLAIHVSIASWVAALIASSKGDQSFSRVRTPRLKLVPSLYQSLAPFLAVCRSNLVELYRFGA